MSGSAFDQILNMAVINFHCKLATLHCSKIVIITSVNTLTGTEKEIYTLFLQRKLQ